MSKIIIEANKKSWLPNIGELIRYRDLFLTLAWRDFKVRYAQTTVGLLWSIIQPIITIGIMSLVFGEFIGVQTPVPHFLYTVSGMAMWIYFSFVLSNSGNSIIGAQGMVKKIYFPRLIIPLSKAVLGLIDLLIVLGILVVLMCYYHVTPSSNIWAAPLFILGTIIVSLGVGIWLSALTVRFRDFQQLVPMILQLGMYLTPIAYPADFAIAKLPSWAAKIYFLNPMAGIIQGFRWSLFGGTAPDGYFWLSMLMIVILFVSSLFYFRSVESEMADYV